MSTRSKPRRQNAKSYPRESASVMGRKGRIPTGQERRDRKAATRVLEIEDLTRNLREQFGKVLHDKQGAERRNTLAILKMLELVVSGRIRQRPGEDYFLTICRLIVHGISDLETSAATRRNFNELLAILRGLDRWTTSLSDVVQMRSCRGKRAIARTVLLLVMLEKLIGPAEVTEWLQRSNPNLGSRAPVDLMRADRWVILADFLDDMLTGSAT